MTAFGIAAALALTSVMAPPTNDEILENELSWEHAWGIAMFPDNAPWEAGVMLLQQDPSSAEAQQLLQLGREIEEDRVWQRYGLPLDPPQVRITIDFEAVGWYPGFEEDQEEVTWALVADPGNPELRRRAEALAEIQRAVAVAVDRERSLVSNVNAQLLESWRLRVKTRVDEVRAFEEREAASVVWRPWRWIPGKLQTRTHEDMVAFHSVAEALLWAAFGAVDLEPLVPDAAAPVQQFVLHRRMTTAECSRCCWTNPDGPGGVWVSAKIMERADRLQDSCLANHLSDCPPGDEVVYQSTCGDLKACSGAWDAILLRFRRLPGGPLIPDQVMPEHNPICELFVVGCGSFGCEPPCDPQPTIQECRELE